MFSCFEKKLSNERKSFRQLKFEPLERRELMAGDVAATAMADFALEDVNPNSGTYGQQVSPRDYLGQVSAWYFGHAT